MLSFVAENSRHAARSRIAFRRAMKKALTTAMKFGAKGVRFRCAGRWQAPKWVASNLPRGSRAAAYAAR